MYCGKCGGTISEQALYCRHCGQDAKTYPSPAAGRNQGQGQVFCRHCGKANNTDNTYCLSCGQSLETEGGGPQVGGDLGQRIEHLGRRVKGLQMFRGQGQGSWTAALVGAVVAVVVGIILAFVVDQLLGRALISMVQEPVVAYFLEGLKPNLVFTWVFSHLPSYYLKVSGGWEGIQAGASVLTHLPLLFLLIIPGLGLWIGSLLATHNLAREDFRSRGRQGIRMGLIYAGLFLLLSPFAGFSLDLPVGEVMGVTSQLLGLPVDFSGVDLKVSYGFGWFSVLINGLLWGTVFGGLAASKFRLSALLQGLLGERTGAGASGVGQACLASLGGGFFLFLIGVLYLITKEDLLREAGWAVVVALLILFPNLLVYGLALGGGSSFRVISTVPGLESPQITLSLLGLRVNGVPQEALTGDFYLLFLLLFLVLASLLWGGYQAQKKTRGAIFWQNGLIVAGGYSLVVSFLAWMSQFKVQLDLGPLGALLGTLSGQQLDKAQFFAGSSFWGTIIVLLVVGTLPASLGAYICARGRNMSRP
ncbi:MAG: hypothetical protein DDT21_02736 [Syntrophomonadaceae bacterium]|nr:hypothetical protein [Bacillota bacterium]